MRREGRRPDGGRRHRGPRRHDQDRIDRRPERQLAPTCCMVIARLLPLRRQIAPGGLQSGCRRRPVASRRARIEAARMDTHDVDVTVIGAGIAGSTAAAALAADRRVALIEAEEAAGYHTTGRSAALWLQNYGPPDVRTLSALSRPFFEHPPAGFAEVPLMTRRAGGVPGARRPARGAGRAARRGRGIARNRRCGGARAGAGAAPGLRDRRGGRGRCVRHGCGGAAPGLSAAVARAAAARWRCATAPGGSSAATAAGRWRPAAAPCSARRSW